jgi:hypothetical protein
MARRIMSLKLRFFCAHWLKRKTSHPSGISKKALRKSERLGCVVFLN